MANPQIHSAHSADNAEGKDPCHRSHAKLRVTAKRANPALALLFSANPIGPCVPRLCPTICVSSCDRVHGGDKYNAHNCISNVACVPEVGCGLLYAVQSTYSEKLVSYMLSAKSSFNLSFCEDLFENLFASWISPRIDLVTLRPTLVYRQYVLAENDDLMRRISRQPHVLCVCLFLVLVCRATLWGWLPMIPQIVGYSTSTPYTHCEVLLY